MDSMRLSMVSTSFLVNSGLFDWLAVYNIKSTIMAIPYCFGNISSIMG